VKLNSYGKSNMKTPKEILFQHHQSVVPKLDALHDRALDGLRPPPKRETMTWWELLRSLRWHLAAMSAVWVVVGVLNFSSSSGPGLVASGKSAASPAQLWASMRKTGGCSWNSRRTHRRRDRSAGTPE